MKTFLTVLLTVLLVPSLAASQNCIDYEDCLHWVGGEDTPGRANDTAVVGSYQDDDAGSNSGSAYIFVRSGVWPQQARAYNGPCGPAPAPRTPIIPTPST